MCSGPSNNMQLTEIRRWKRDAAPAHFLLKINSFSHLSRIVQNSGVHKYESGHFEVSDYKWNLAVYPNGNPTRNGEGYISLYLALADTNPISNGSQIELTVKFFVYDQILDKYLTVQDGKVKRFNVLKTEHGVDQLLPLATFNDSSNGYLVDDCCTFGVEVIVIKRIGKVEEFSLIQEPTNATYTWNIESFSTLHQDHHYSEVFYAAGSKWRLQLYPRGDSREKNRCLSLFLWRLEDNLVGQGVYVEHNLVVKDQVNGMHEKAEGVDWFRTEDGWGYSSFMLLSDLHNTRRFLVNDTLIVEVEVNLIAAVKALSLT